MRKNMRTIWGKLWGEYGRGIGPNLGPQIGGHSGVNSGVTRGPFLPFQEKGLRIAKWATYCSSGRRLVPSRRRIRTAVVFLQPSRCSQCVVVFVADNGVSFPHLR